MKLGSRSIVFSLGVIAAASVGQAFTLMAASPVRYGEPRIRVNIASHDCRNIGITADELRGYTMRAVNKYWNTVTSSSLELYVADGLMDVSESSTLDELMTECPANEILIACSDSAELFESSSTLGAAKIASTQPAKGVVAINNRSISNFDDLSDSNIEATIAHELGHAFGIGHSSHEHALMYFSINDAIKQDQLAFDDSDAATYLYPNGGNVEEIFGACGSTKNIGQGGGSSNGWLLSCLLSLLVFILSTMGIYRLARRREKSFKLLYGA